MCSAVTHSKTSLATLCALLYMAPLYAESTTDTGSTSDDFSRRLERIDVEANSIKVEVKSDGLTDLTGFPASDRDYNIRRMQRESMHYSGGGFHVRYRKGEDGLDKLVETSIPVQMNFNVGVGRARFDVTPIFLSSGELSSSEYVDRYYGTNALYAPDVRETNTSNSQGGVAFEVGYEVGGFGLKMGMTPVGFVQSNGTAELKFDHAFSGGFNFGISTFREAITDSMLSYAGLEDEASGLTWGAVTKNGGSLRLGYDAGGFGVYSEFVGAIYLGENIPDNDFYQFTGGIYFIPYKGDYLQLNGGFNVTYFEFEHNLRYFTYGQGGYFSPEQFYTASIPLSLSYTKDNISLSLEVTVGFQYFTEAESVFYPNDPDLQSALEVFEAEQPVTFDANSETKFANKIAINLDYFLTDQFSARAKLETQSAADYEESLIALNVEYRF